MTANQIKYQEHLERARSNLAQEDETKRSNLAGEALRRSEIEETSRHNLVTEKETERSNREREMETKRSNLARELETSKHNRAQEGIGYANVNLGFAQAAENAAHNRATEAIGREQNLNTREFNTVRAAETHRANVAQETLKKHDVQEREKGADRRTKAQIEGQITASEVRSIPGLIGSLVNLVR